jgi:hypothetical protein
MGAAMYGLRMQITVRLLLAKGFQELGNEILFISTMDDMGSEIKGHHRINMKGKHYAVFSEAWK